MATDWLADVRKYAPDADEAVVGKIVRYLGIALRNRDSSLVSFSDAKETGRVRGNFLKKKLGLTQSDEALDAAIAAVGERMKADRTKNRVTVYYLLADHFGALDVFGGTKGAAKPAAPAKKAAAPKAAAAKTATAKTAAPAAKADTPAAKAPAKKTAATPAKKDTAAPAKAAKAPAAKAAATKAAAPAKPKAAKPATPKATAPKATATKATLVSPAPEASTPTPPPPPPPPPSPPPPPTPAPPVAPDAGASGVLAAANLGSGDDAPPTASAKGGGSGGTPPPSGGGSRWWVWVLAIAVLVAIVWFWQARREPEPKPGWDANLSADFNTTSDPAADNAELDNAVDGALSNDVVAAPETNTPTQ